MSSHTSPSFDFSARDHGGRPVSGPRTHDIRAGKPGVPTGKVTVPGLQSRVDAGEKITALTAYDYPSGLLADRAGIDLLLVGDSLANTMLGYENTLLVSQDEMLMALRAVRRAVRRALLVVDMPFGSYHTDATSALEAAVRFVKSGAEAIKLEGGRRRIGLVRRIVDNEIPVMGHIGLTPQSLHAQGGYKVQGKLPDDAERLLDDALALQGAGAFSIVLEGIPAPLGERITDELSIPTIGIGAGKHCDGQILVFADLLGLLPGRDPKFVRRYLEFHDLALEAIQAYRDDIQTGSFPSIEESYQARAALKATP